MDFIWEISMEENFNSHLGKKLRMRRLSLGLTQTKVAQAINVTFQQIQKYVFIRKTYSKYFTVI